MNETYENILDMIADIIDGWHEKNECIPISISETLRNKSKSLKEREDILSISREIALIMLPHKKYYNICNTLKFVKDELRKKIVLREEFDMNRNLLILFIYPYYYLSDTNYCKVVQLKLDELNDLTNKEILKIIYNEINKTGYLK